MLSASDSASHVVLSWDCCNIAGRMLCHRSVTQMCHDVKPHSFAKLAWRCQEILVISWQCKHACISMLLSRVMMLLTDDLLMSSGAMLLCWQGLWRLAIYNPMRPYRIGYSLTAVKLAHCLNDCSGHGTCDSNGNCQCDSNWAGGDCSVNQAGSGGCQEGTHKSSAM